VFKSRGLFITLEGIDGCGKSTQTAMLFEWFNQQKLAFIQVREPGGTVTGEAVRQILLDNKYALSVCRQSCCLYMAARAELTEQVIIPALKSGQIVVLADRFTDSTMAYQGYGGGASLQWIRTLNKKVTCGIKPDMTILLDLSGRRGCQAARWQQPTAWKAEI
jgi:dTMP kinase